MWTASWESTKPRKDLIRWGNKLHSIGVREEFKSHKDYQKYKRRSELEGCAGCALFFRPEEIKSCWKSNVGRCWTLFRDREIWEVWWAACFLTMVHKHGCRYWKRFACYKGLISVPALFMNQKLLLSSWWGSIHVTCGHVEELCIINTFDRLQLIAEPLRPSHHLSHDVFAMLGPWILLVTKALERSELNALSAVPR